MGSHWAFAVAATACLIWALTGPTFHYSNTWQLVINTATTVMTFLAVFLIQNTQNRNSLAVQLKLDENSMTLTVETPRGQLVFTPEERADGGVGWQCSGGPGVAAARLPTACRDDASSETAR